MKKKRRLKRLSSLPEVLRLERLVQHPLTKEIARTSSKQSSRKEADHSLEATGPMTEIALSQKQEVENVLDAAKLATEQRLQSAEQLTRHATTAARKDIFLKCAMHQRDLIVILTQGKEIVFS